MQNRLLKFAREQNLIAPGDTVICAMSGGADSVAMLFALYLLREKLGITLEAAHFNHNLRGEESLRDETFVRELVEAGILTLIRDEPGCLAYDYYFSAQDENELLLIERWESAAHQRVHMEQPHMARLREIKDKYITDTRLGRVRLED